jgi:hypothetical protein
VWITKASASEPLMKRRKQIGDIETRASFVSWDESGGCLLIGQAVSAWRWRERGLGSRAERVNLYPDGAAGQWSGCGLRLVAWSENLKRLNPRGGA